MLCATGLGLKILFEFTTTYTSIYICMCLMFVCVLKKVIYSHLLIISFMVHLCRPEIVRCMVWNFIPADMHMKNLKVHTCKCKSSYLKQYWSTFPLFSIGFIPKTSIFQTCKTHGNMENNFIPLTKKHIRSAPVVISLCQN